MGKLAHDIQTGRLLVMHAAWKLDQGDFAKKEISMAKVHVADVLHDAADTAIQLCGAKGYSRDTVLEWIYRYARQARLVDGASEVHRMVRSALTFRTRAAGELDQLPVRGYANQTEFNVCPDGWSYPGKLAVGMCCLQWFRAV